MSWTYKFLDPNAAGPMWSTKRFKAEEEVVAYLVARRLAALPQFEGWTYEVLRVPSGMKLP